MIVKFVEDGVAQLVVDDTSVDDEAIQWRLFVRVEKALDASEDVLDVGSCLIGFDVRSLCIFAVDALTDCPERFVWWDGQGDEFGALATRVCELAESVAEFVLADLHQCR